MAGIEEDWSSQGCSTPATYQSFTNKYQIVREVQEGSYGTVKIVRTVERNTSVDRAAKFVYLSRIQDPEVRNTHYIRTVNEVKIYHVLQGMDLISDGHENIIKFYGWYVNPGRVIVQVYELLKEDLFDRFIKLNSTIPEHKAKPIIKQIVRALKFMHDKDIAHRDLKLENVLCVHAVELSPVKLCDLNLSKVKEISTALSPLDSPVGTDVSLDPQRAHWMVNDGPTLNYGRKCDMYGVGLIAHELLTRVMPFAENSHCGKNCGATNRAECPDCLKKNLQLRMTQTFDVENSAIKAHTEHCKDFVDSLLKREEADRLSSTEALLHPWLQRRFH